MTIFFVHSGANFQDLGSDYYTQFNREKIDNSHIMQLIKLDISLPDEFLLDKHHQVST